VVGWQNLQARTVPPGPEKCGPATPAPADVSPVSLHAVSGLCYRESVSLTHHATWRQAPGAARDLLATNTSWARFHTAFSCAVRDDGTQYAGNPGQGPFENHGGHEAEGAMASAPDCEFGRRRTSRCILHQHSGGIQWAGIRYGGRRAADQDGAPLGPHAGRFEQKARRSSPLAHSSAEQACHIRPCRPPEHRRVFFGHPGEQAGQHRVAGSPSLRPRPPKPFAISIRSEACRGIPLRPRGSCRGCGLSLRCSPPTATRPQSPQQGTPLWAILAVMLARAWAPPAARPSGQWQGISARLSR